MRMTVDRLRIVYFLLYCTMRQLTSPHQFLGQCLFCPVEDACCSANCFRTYNDHSNWFRASPSLYIVGATDQSNTYLSIAP